MEWQPIETAPKNPFGERVGPAILIFDKRMGMSFVAHWGYRADGKACWVEGAPWNSISSAAEGSFYFPDDVTHWMPLPEPPNAP